MEWLTTATTAGLDLLSTVISTITTTPELALQYAMGTIVPCAIGLFAMFGHATRR